MRVIAGTCRSLPLKSVPGSNTRPTTDRIKETLFNILQPYIPGSNFLDLYAGSGAIGIEALSRGAAHAWFADHDRRAVQVIRDNLRFTKLDGQADVLFADALEAAGTLAGRQHFDVIFMDPPYGKGLEQEIFRFFSSGDHADKDTLFVVEASLQTSFEWLESLGFMLIREKIYKTNKHVFARLKTVKRTEES